MDLYPAIDLRGGRIVRLTEGDFNQETHYGDDPIAVAQDFVAQGAPWIHVVDLDAAKGDGPINAETIKAIAAAVDVPVQTGGGQVDNSSLKAGVRRIVLGSLAISDPERAKALIRAYPGRVAVGLDHRHGRIAVRGWQEESDQTVDDVPHDFAADSGAALMSVERVRLLEHTDGPLATVFRRAGLGLTDGRRKCGVREWKEGGDGSGASQKDLPPVPFAEVSALLHCALLCNALLKILYGSP